MNKANLWVLLHLNGCIYSTGNYHDSLSDAKAATELQPTFLKAIVRGKDCVRECHHTMYYEG